ncbi:tripartite tricarboxylate transporter substrate-binding protein [Bradyrhizobium sp. Tv2a-2]|uniref:Bug family tripartite tricarboxylate transporter substrate binding protein n=1 Tax=Bradyrhizobium sp. Tv2a-2 TaxID=113395 RepID=UPI000405492D|nr:tripartite tricarboxylate transporter substrate-binding protein [Bradyrhizobium sp. Tv2a-2]
MRWRPALLASLLVYAFAPQIRAELDYPRHQIRIIVPFPPGAGPDQVARLVGQHLQDAFGQTVLIENRAGALGSIAAQEVARSAPDGYTLLMGTNTTHAGNVAIRPPE